MIHHDTEKDKETLDPEKWVDLYMDMELCYGQLGQNPNLDLKVFPLWMTVLKVEKNKKCGTMMSNK